MWVWSRCWHMFAAQLPLFHDYIPITQLKSSCFNRKSKITSKHQLFTFSSIKILWFTSNHCGLITEFPSESSQSQRLDRFLAPKIVESYDSNASITLSPCFLPIFPMFFQPWNHPSPPWAARFVPKANLWRPSTASILPPPWRRWRSPWRGLKTHWRGRWKKMVVKWSPIRKPYFLKG